MTSQQMGLFDDDEVAVKKEEYDASDIIWSYSRSTLFNQCSLKYYNQHYGSHKRSPDAQQETIEFLKNLQPRFLYGGDRLHRTIQNYFNYPSPQNMNNTDSFVRRAIARVQEDRNYSRTFDETNDVTENQTVLMEYFYQFPDAELLYDELEERLGNALYTFAESPNFAEFRRIGLLSESLVEKSFYINNVPPCTIRGQVDLAYHTDDGIVIVDWKFGSEDDIGQDSLQLATYALWAIQEFDYSISDIQLYKAYLGSDQVKEFPLTEVRLTTAKVGIVQDAERMAQYHRYGNQRQSDAFTPCLYPNICQLCQYQGLCYD